MRKLTSFFLSSVLLVALGACAAKTSTEAPNSAPEPGEANQSSPAVEAPETDEAKASQEDATGELRRKQLNSDIRAREQRNNATGGDTERAEGDLESEVRSKLEANLPASALTVEADDDGAVTILGTVPTQEQFNKIESLAKEIKGVKSVVVKATVAPAKSDANN